MMQQNVKYDSLTGKVYEELGCPSKSSNNKESQKSNSDQDIKKNVNNEMSTTSTLNNKESEPLSHHDTRCVITYFYGWSSKQKVTPCQKENHIFLIIYWVCQELSSHIWPLLKQLVFLRQLICTYGSNLKPNRCNQVKLVQILDK